MGSSLAKTTERPENSPQSKNVTLLNVPLFSQFEVSELRQISGFSSVKRFKKHDTIFLQGDPYSGFYLVLKGKVKVYRISAEGKESIVHLIRPFDPFAEVPLFEQLKHYPVSAQALEESVVFFIPKDDFINFIEAHPQIYFKIITGFAKKLRELTTRLESLATNEVTTRLANYLIQELNQSALGKQNGKRTVILDIQKSTLAGYLGTITETLSRTFKKLQDEKIIEVDGKQITILDFARLKELAK